MKSIITEYTENCILCGRPNVEPHHLINGRGNREIADKYFCVIPVCRDCHNLIHSDARIVTLSKILGQIAWEGKYGDREDFRRTFKKSWC